MDKAHITQIGDVLGQAIGQYYRMINSIGNRDATRWDILLREWQNDPYPSLTAPLEYIAALIDASGYQTRLLPYLDRQAWHKCYAAYQVEIKRLVAKFL